MFKDLTPYQKCLSKGVTAREKYRPKSAVVAVHHRSLEKGRCRGEEYIAWSCFRYHAVCTCMYEWCDNVFLCRQRIFHLG